MKVIKPMIYMALGAGAAIVCQKYSKPLINKMEDTASDVVKKIDKKLDDMMK